MATIQELLPLATNDSIVDPERAPETRSAKVSLARYRAASRDVVAAICSVVDKARVERASIDEVYVDATDVDADDEAPTYCGSDGARAAGDPRGDGL